MSKSCRLASLAKGESGAILRCSCGQIHLHLGQVTLRLDESAFEDLAMLTQTAMGSLSAMQTAQRTQFRVLHNEAYSG